MLLALSTLCCLISRRSLLAIGVKEIFALKERELYAIRLCLFLSQILPKLFRKSLKFQTKRDIPASFKCNLLLLRYLLVLMFLCDIMPTLFALHNSSNIILTLSTSFLFSSSCGTTLETITVLFLISGSWLDLKCPEIFAQEICWRIGHLFRHVVNIRLDWSLSELVLYSLPRQSSFPKRKVLLSQYIFD